MPANQGIERRISIFDTDEGLPASSLRPERN
jgi:hypothetical protein